MKSSRLEKGWRILGAIALAAFLLVFPPVGGGIVNGAAPPDADLDGFPDAVENGTNTFRFAGSVNPAVTWSKCATPWIAGSNCVDPAKKDLFVVFVTPSSVMPALDRLKILNNLGNVSAHEVPQNHVTATKIVAKNSAGSLIPEKAVFVTDNPTTTPSDVLGITLIGTPNSTSGSVIYTQRIVAFLNTTCAGKTCIDVNTTPNLVYGPDNGFRDQFVRQVVAHELGHAMTLVSPQDSVIGAHYPAENKVVMSQYVYKEYPASNEVRFFIPGIWTDNDRQKVRLK
jgi:hypothetical protein